MSSILRVALEGAFTNFKESFLQLIESLIWS